MIFLSNHTISLQLRGFSTLIYIRRPLGNGPYKDKLRSYLHVSKTLLEVFEQCFNAYIVDGCKAGRYLLHLFG